MRKQRAIILVRVEPGLAKRIKAAAKADGRSVNSLVERLLWREHGQGQIQPEAR